MKKIAAVLPGICLALMPFVAKADTLKFDGSSGSIGPYNMTLNPGPGSTSLSLFCMNDTDYIQTNESWGVNVYLGSSLSTDFSATVAKEYEEEAYILSQLSTDGNTAVQDALWAVFDSSDVSHLTGTTKLLYDAAIGSAGSSFISSGGYDNYVFYIYNNQPNEIVDRYGNSVPQNFIGAPAPAAPTPEPSGLLLLGTGLTATAGALRRKMARP